MNSSIIRSHPYGDFAMEAAVRYAEDWEHLFGFTDAEETAEFLIDLTDPMGHEADDEFDQTFDDVLATLGGSRNSGIATLRDRIDFARDQAHEQSGSFARDTADYNRSTF